MFSSQLEATPICHLALEKSINDLNKGDLFEICFIFWYFTDYSSVNELFLIIMKNLLLKFINFDDYNPLRLVCYS